MKITEVLELSKRSAWRTWLTKHHAVKQEIWLVRVVRAGESFTYLDSVEEALCFGWVDGIAKKDDPNNNNPQNNNQGRLAQRFTPRRKKSHWTELNKERARRLIAKGLMTEAGQAVLPDLEVRFEIPKDICAALQKDRETWCNFQNFPDTYKRIRVSYIEEMRKNPEVFRTRLEHFLKKTKQNKQFGVME